MSQERLNGLALLSIENERAKNFDFRKVIQQFARRRRLNGIHSRSDTKGFILLLTQTAALPESDAGSGVISQHQVLSSKTVRPSAPCGARCIGHTVSTWSSVCSEAPHSQFGEGARPHLCMDEWNCPTPVRRRLSLTQATRVSPSQQAWHRSRAQKQGA